MKFKKSFTHRLSLFSWMIVVDPSAWKFKLQVKLYIVLSPQYGSTLSLNTVIIIKPTLNSLIYLHDICISSFLICTTLVLYTCFCPGSCATKHSHHPSQSLVSDPTRKVPINVKHYVICKSVMSFEPIAVNMNFAPVSVSLC